MGQGKKRGGFLRAGGRGGRGLLTLASVLALLPMTLRADDARRHDAGVVLPRVVIVGGGPDLENNQVAIESNVRYVNKLLPAATSRTVLFADGDPNHASVLYEDDTRDLSVGERLLLLLMRGNTGGESLARHRKPNLGVKMDGASKRADLERVFDELSVEKAEKPDAPARPLLLYFTGHGSPDGQVYENNMYDLWGRDEALHVTDLARLLARLPDQTPVTLVMVQCFSGAFANLLHIDGNPQKELTDRDIAGFFAAIKEREAAGCTSEVNEAEYHDFTSYFFAALTGRDRMGRRVTGVDYNGDGRVGMDEAYCYTLANDKSIDIPTCTSDILLRQYPPITDTEVFKTPYSQVRAWASPAQRAALEKLSEYIGGKGEDRLAAAYDRVAYLRVGSRRSGNDAEETLGRKFNQLRAEGRSALLRRWPALRSPGATDFKKSRQEAIADLGRQASAGKFQELLDADDNLDKLTLETEAKDILDARLLRFVRLGKSVVLTHKALEGENAPLKARLARLIALESRTLLPPADAAKTAAK